MSSVLKFDRIPSRVTTSVLRVTGKAEASVASIEAGTSYSSLSKIQLTGGRFSAVLELTPGRNQFVFQPYAAGGSPLQSEIEVITYEHQTLESYVVTGALDMHAAELGYERLPGERNVSFKKRLLQGSKGREDVRKHVPIAMATELGFPFSKDMVRVKVARTKFNHPSLTAGFVKITPTAFKYTGDQLVTSEGPVVFDVGYPYITPAQEVSPFSNIRLYREGGDPVAQSDYEYQTETNRIWLRNDALVGSDLLLVYNYVNSISIESGDITALKTAVELQTYLELEITDSEFHTSSDLAALLIPQDWTLIPDTEDYPSGALRTNPGVYLSVSEIRAFPLHEHKQDYLDNGSGLGTKLQKYVSEVNIVDHRNWERFVVGRDGLRDENITPLYDAFPHLSDPKRGHWGQNMYNIHQVQYLGTGLNDAANPFVGIIPQWWQSGAGHLGDLEPDSPVQELDDISEITDATDTPINPLYGIL